MRATTCFLVPLAAQLEGLGMFSKRCLAEPRWVHQTLPGSTSLPGPISTTDPPVVVCVSVALSANTRSAAGQQDSTTVFERSLDMGIMRMLLFVVLVLAPLVLSAPEKEKYAKSNKKMKLASRQICADLCTQGLGGPPCGDVCEYDLGHDFGISIPDKEKPTLAHRIVGARRNVCPYLCQYELGEPLCECKPLRIHHDKSTIDWHGVCDAFCHIEGLSIYGCPKCYQDPSKIADIPFKPYTDDSKPIKKPDAETLIKHGFKIVAAFDHDGKALVSEGGANLLADLSETHDVKEVRWGADNSEVWRLSIPKTNQIKQEETPIDWDRWCEIKCFHGEGGSACNCDALP